MHTLTLYQMSYGYTSPQILWLTNTTPPRSHSQCEYALCPTDNNNNRIIILLGYKLYLKTMHVLTLYRMCYGYTFPQILANTTPPRSHSQCEYALCHDDNNEIEETRNLTDQPYRIPSTAVLSRIRGSSSQSEGCCEAEEIE